MGKVRETVPDGSVKEGSWKGNRAKGEVKSIKQSMIFRLPQI